MIFKGKARRLDDVDIPRLGAMIGVGEDEVHAVMDVEARNSGFDSQGRPAMLFEPHIFWRELGPGPLRDKAAKEGLAYPKWRRNYPSDSYPRLIRAMAYGVDPALMSASWGLGQIMGFNHSLAGYESAKAMVADFLEDEENHLQAMVSFIKSAKLDDELRAKDWEGFARGYNGPQYAKNGYHTKLAAAYAKWSNIRDTPWTPYQEPVKQIPIDLPLVDAAGREPSAVDQEAGSGWWSAITALFSAIAAFIGKGKA